MIAKKSFGNSLTAGIDYQVVRTNKNNIVVMDNQGFEVGFGREYFEQPKLIHSKEELIEAYREGFNNDLPFIDMEKWYNEKFGKNEPE